MDKNVQALYRTLGADPAPTSAETPPDAEGVLRYRTIWISDVHLGTRGCKAEALLDFLRRTESDRLYLVGDIIDGWKLKSSWYWPQSHNDVVQKILRKARKGTKVTYVPGNHDEAARDFVGMVFGGVTVRNRVTHTTADGRRLLVMHGDEFDGVIGAYDFIGRIGSWAYDVVLEVNRWFNLARRRLGFSYWSLSAYLKHKVKDAVSFIAHYEDALVSEARKCRVDGVVCGHIHKPEMREIGGILYCNDGDWVESCTALAEHPDGRLEILQWDVEPASARAEEAPPTTARRLEPVAAAV
jgi:UDP-2,3-diacylglucosamine pyrophosphatase LpxH